jgi:2-oxoglutarate/2-oxoacid ferredoxin oxidoreductase subunit beta
MPRWLKCTLIFTLFLLQTLQANQLFLSYWNLKYEPLLKKIAMPEPEEFINSTLPTWCKGCSFYSVLSSLSQMLSSRVSEVSKVNVISGIGCSSRLPLYLNTFGMHTLHGRAIPVAVGARLSRPDVPVIVAAGDGDLFSIGLSHFVHAARKNFKMMVLCMDNGMFAMTKNQSSPTSNAGHRGSLTPQGKIEQPLNLVDFSIACDATFVARTIADNDLHMKYIFTEAFDHSGFAFIHIITRCKTFENHSIFSEIGGRTVDINNELNHNPTDRSSALKYSTIPLQYNTKGEKKFPIGIFWKCKKPIYELSI